MRFSGRWVAVVPIIAGIQLSACQSASSSGSVHVAPAQVEKIEGTGLSRVTLTAKAAERLGIATATVDEIRVAQTGVVRSQGDPRGMQLQSDPTAGTRTVPPARSGSRLVVPYGAVLYDSKGDTWVYTSPQPLVFVRHHITIDYIRGDQAVLLAGPPVGTRIVTVGAAELLGTEFEVGH
jgi:hypothetical protein